MRVYEGKKNFHKKLPDQSIPPEQGQRRSDFPPSSPQSNGKERTQVGKQTRRSIFRFPCSIFRIRNHPSIHRSIGSHRSVGDRDRWFELSFCILRSSVAPYRIFDISVPYPVGTPCGKASSSIDHHTLKKHRD